MADIFLDNSSIIGSGNDSAPKNTNRKQATIWTNEDLIQWRIYIRHPISVC